MSNPNWTIEAERELIGILQDLIRLESVNPPGCEKAAADHIKDILEKEGINCRIIEKEEGRSNLVAVCKGAAAKTPIILLSHLDVVPVKRDEWSFDGFSGDIVDGYLQGRGTIDTKQLTAMEIMALLLLVRENKSFDRTVICIASADEEGGSSKGMQYLTENYPEYFPEGAWVLSEGGGFTVHQDGTDYRLCVCGEKGKFSVRVKIIREEADNEQESIDLLMERANNLLYRLSSHQPAETITEVMRVFGETVTGEEYSDKTLRDLWEYGTHNDMQILAFDISAGNEETLSGIELNIDYKILPGYTEEECRQLFGSLIDSAIGNISWEVTGFTEGYLSDLESSFARDLDAVSAKHDPGTVFLPMIALGNTDGRFIGSNVFGYSPMLDDMPFSKVLTMVHGKDERISLPSLVYGGRVIYEVLHRLVLEG